MQKLCTAAKVSSNVADLVLLFTIASSEGACEQW